MGGVLTLPDVGELYPTERIVVIGIHGGTIMRTSLLGDATGTSPKFASTMKRAILKRSWERRGYDWSAILRSMEQ